MNAVLKVSAACACVVLGLWLAYMPSRREDDAWLTPAILGLNFAALALVVWSYA